MNQTLATQLGDHVLDNATWKFFNVWNNLSSGIPPSGNLQYLSWNSTFNNSNYTYLRYSHSITHNFSNTAITAIDFYFRPNIFSYHVLCTYPISGQYGFLNRLLYYILMIFALLVRKRTWLSAAALGTAMTYAASAAVHAFALLA